MDISESVDKILEADEMLGNTFYDAFFNRHPAVEQYFVGVDLTKQSVLLTMALMTIEQYASHSYPALGKYLVELGARHCDWGIPLDKYPEFREALLETLQRFHGEHWTEQLAEQWRQAIDKSIAQMSLGYKDATPA